MPDRSQRSAHIQQAGHLTAIVPDWRDLPAERSVSDRKRAEAEEESARTDLPETGAIKNTIAPCFWSADEIWFLTWSG